MYRGTLKKSICALKKAFSTKVKYNHRSLPAFLIMASVVSCVTISESHSDSSPEKIQNKLGQTPLSMSENYIDPNEKDCFKGFRPDSTKWTRVDEVLHDEKYTEFKLNNVFHDTLVGEGMLERHEIYKLNYEPVVDQTKLASSAESAGSGDITSVSQSHEIMGLIKFGHALNGHPGVVHGGILAMSFDNMFGWVFFAANMQAGFTANLNVNFRKPVFAGTVVRIHSKLVEKKDRKKYLEATMYDAKTGVVLAESTSLFILPKGKPNML